VVLQRRAHDVKSLDAPGAAIMRWWDRLSDLPGGKTVFSIAVGRTAPYTSSIGARVEELRPGYSRWRMSDRRRLRNHLNSVHAVALVNLAEVTSGTAMLVTLPAGIRGIVTALSISYIKKARGTLIAECHCTVPDVTHEVSCDVSADVRDAAGDIVARATVTWLLARKSETMRSS
jgi:uncharacterized protein (TIGR00369 family)